MKKHPPLVLGCAFSDRIEALLDGRVKVDGRDLDIRLAQPQVIFTDLLSQRTYDLAEMSLATHLAQWAAGDRHYVALPIFLSRAFRHSNIYIGRGSGIDQPMELAGKRIGIIDFYQTAAVWVRGLLHDECGVDRRSIEWVTGGLQTPQLQDRVPVIPADGLRVRRSTAALDSLLEAGEIDAIISPIAPKSFGEGRGTYPLFPDFAAIERAYYKTTQIFPIMHCLVVRASCLEQDPHLASRLLDAFTAAKALADHDLRHRDYAKISLPWVADHATRIKAEVGELIWSYGLEQNRMAIERFLSYAVADGLFRSHPKTCEVFPFERA